MNGLTASKYKADYVTEEYTEFYNYILVNFENSRDKGLRAVIDQFNKDVWSIYGNSILPFENGWREKINFFCNEILKAYEAYLEGLIGKCYNIIEDLLFVTYNSMNLGLEISLREFNLFRMRSNDSQYVYTKNEIMHIPFDKRGMVSNQRYSVSGFPCLYLGSSVYLCWEELGRPEFGSANVGVFKARRKLKLLDLRMPDNITCLSDVYRFILAASCSLEVKNHNDYFKEEYIIPQSILHSLISYNKRFEECYDGIIYLSSFYWSDQKLWTDKNLFMNIVLPTCITYSEGTIVNYPNGICDKLSELFEIKGPNIWNIIDYMDESPIGCPVLECNVMYGNSQIYNSRNNGYDGYLSSKFHRLSAYLIANAK